MAKLLWAVAMAGELRDKTKHWKNNLEMEMRKNTAINAAQLFFQTLWDWLVIDVAWIEQKIC